MYADRQHIELYGLHSTAFNPETKEQVMFASPVIAWLGGSEDINPDVLAIIDAYYEVHVGPFG